MFQSIYIWQKIYSESKITAKLRYRYFIGEQTKIVNKFGWQ
jgi:hypothetical protein